MNDHFRVAVLVDVHGNYYALQAVLDDVAACAPDRYVFGGDIVSGAATVISAMGQAKEAAKAIDEYIKNKLYRI